MAGAMNANNPFNVAAQQATALGRTVTVGGQAGDALEAFRAQNAKGKLPSVQQMITNQTYQFMVKDVAKTLTNSGALDDLEKVGKGSPWEVAGKTLYNKQDGLWGKHFSSGLLDVNKQDFAARFKNKILLLAEPLRAFIDTNNGVSHWHIQLDEMFKAYFTKIQMKEDEKTAKNLLETQRKERLNLLNARMGLNPGGANLPSAVPPRDTNTTLSRTQEVYNNAYFGTDSSNALAGVTLADVTPMAGASMHNRPTPAVLDLAMDNMSTPKARTTAAAATVNAASVAAVSAPSREKKRKAGAKKAGSNKTPKRPPTGYVDHTLDFGFDDDGMGQNLNLLNQSTQNLAMCMGNLGNMNATPGGSGQRASSIQAGTTPESQKKRNKVESKIQGLEQKYKSYAGLFKEAEATGQPTEKWQELMTKIQDKIVKLEDELETLESP